MNRDFMMGAELALRGAGIKDEATRQSYLNKLTDAQIAKFTQDIKNEQDFQQYAQNFMKPTWGTTGAYTPPGATTEMMTTQPSLGSPEFIQGAMKFLSPAQAVTAATALETRETPQQKFLRDAMIAQIRAGKETPSDFGIFYKAHKAKGLTDEQVSTLWHDQKVKEASASGQARAAGFGDIRQLMVIDPVTKQPRYMNANEINEANKAAQAAGTPENMPQPAAQNVEQIGKVAKAKVPGTMRAASVVTASNVMNQEVPEIINLRQVVKAKNLLPTGGIKSLEAFNQWVGAETSDPDTALLKKKVKMLADNLQRTIGGSQGGQWAFEVAADILNPAYDTPAFTNIVLSHTKTLQRMAKAYQTYGSQEVEVDSNWDKAVMELSKRGKIINDQTIAQALKKLGGK